MGQQREHSYSKRHQAIKLLSFVGFSLDGQVDWSQHAMMVSRANLWCAGLTYGVAKNATLVAVRALDCFGQASYTNVITVGSACTPLTPPLQSSRTPVAPLLHLSCMFLAPLLHPFSTPCAPLTPLLHPSCTFLAPLISRHTLLHPSYIRLHPLHPSDAPFECVLNPSYTPCTMPQQVGAARDLSHGFVDFVFIYTATLLTL